MIIDRTHPELKRGEMFLCNVTVKNYALIGWKTKRTGTIAYDICGNKIKGLFPVFVQKREYDERRKEFGIGYTQI